MPIKIATLNLCLGLQFKKNLVKEFILNEKIDILCMQETEIKNNIALPNLTIPGFDIEIEHNVKCSRVGIYIKSGLNYIWPKITTKNVTASISNVSSHSEGINST